MKRRGFLASLGAALGVAAVAMRPTRAEALSQRYPGARPAKIAPGYAAYDEAQLPRPLTVGICRTYEPKLFEPFDVSLTKFDCSDQGLAALQRLNA
jgi:hypothetical protein